MSVASTSKVPGSTGGQERAVQRSAGRHRRGRPGQHVPHVPSQLAVAAGDQHPHGAVARHRAGAPGSGRRPGTLDHRGPVAQRLPPATGGRRTRRRCRPGPGRRGPSAPSPAPGGSWRSRGGSAGRGSGRSGTISLSDCGLPVAVEHGVGDLLDRRPRRRSHVVGLPHRRAEDQLDGPAVVIDVQPLPPVLGRRVQGERLVVEGRAVNRGITFSGNW